MKVDLELLLHTRTALIDGSKIEESPEHIATEICYAKKGDRIDIKSSDYIFAVGTYALERDLRFKEEYCYLPDSAWVTYKKDLNIADYSSEGYIFNDTCYYKICFKRADGQEMKKEDLETIKSHLIFSPCFRDEIVESEDIKTYFYEEIQETISTVKRSVKSEEDLKLIVLTDTHVALNGTWADTEKNIERVCREVKADVIVHLGDLTDGITSKKRTLRLANEVIDGLKKNDVPVYITLGNHDANYFYNNKESMTIEEQAALYLKRDKSYYYVDIKGIRLIFLSAYDNNNKHRYGFLDEEVTWLKTLLSETDEHMHVMIFSHDAPLTKLDYWSDHIYNGDRVVEILENDNKLHNRILCFIHGHTHADYIYKALSFPIVSIGCNKCEDFQMYKPENTYTCARRFDHVTQDLWDYVIVSKELKNINLIRFGAGEDRSVK